NDDTIGSFADITNKLKDQSSISIHIRRGDYLAKVSLDVLGLLPLEYYNRAIELIKSKVKNTVFYFFSDDIDWVKTHLQIPEAIYVSNKITKSHIGDLYLMSQCKHHI